MKKHSHLSATHYNFRQQNFSTTHMHHTLTPRLEFARTVYAYARPFIAELGELRHLRCRRHRLANVTRVHTHLFSTPSLGGSNQPTARATPFDHLDFLTGSTRLDRWPYSALKKLRTAMLHEKSCNWLFFIDLSISHDSRNSHRRIMQNQRDLIVNFEWLLRYSKQNKICFTHTHIFTPKLHDSNVIIFHITAHAISAWFSGDSCQICMPEKSQPGIPAGALNCQDGGEKSVSFRANRRIYLR